MRVLTLTPFYPTAADDSQGCFVAELLPWLGRVGVSNAVIAAQPFYRKGSVPNPGSVPADWVRYLSLPGNVGLASAGAFLYSRILPTARERGGRGEIDLIHAHAALPCGHAAMLLSKELDIPFVVSVHGLDAYSVRQVKGRPGEWCRRISAAVFRSAKQVVCVSHHVRESVLAGGAGMDNSSVVYNGVDVERFTATVESEPVAPRVVSVGNLIPTKGHEILLRAASKIVGQQPNLVCEIIGDGPELPRLQRLVRELGISDHVRFSGRLPRDRVVKALQQAAVFVLPSRYEGLGCVYLEAMACGRVAIGCRGQGIEEIIQHGVNGWLVGGDSTEELAHAMADLLGNRGKRDQISIRARQTILGGLTMAHQAENMVRVYRDSLA